MNNILETIKKELRSTIRDKKSLLMMFLIPLLIPIVVIFISFMYETMMDTDTTYIVGTNYILNDIEDSIIEELNLEVITYDNIEEVENAYNSEEIDAYIILENNTYNIYANSESTNGSVALTLIATYLDTYNNVLGSNYLNSLGVDTNLVYSNINYEMHEIEEENTIVNLVISMAFTFTIISITMTASYNVTDSIAGEKERGTLETLLTFPVKSEEIVIGKYIAITASCIITAIISILLAILSITLCTHLFTIYENIVINFSFVNILLVFLITVGFSLFISGLFILITTYAKSYKEAQSMLSPVSLIVLIPMFLEMLNFKLNPILSLIPVLNHTILINDIFCGNINYTNIIIMFISTISYVLFLILYIKNQYKKEKVIFS